jgi:hypothetical protein
VLSLVAGCQQPGVPSTLSKLEDQLVGLSTSALKAQLGPPDSERLMSQPPHFGPYPSGLQAGESCTYLYYGDYQGQQLHVFCVAPKVYSRVKGTAPDDQQDRVLEVFSYPKETRF